MLSLLFLLWRMQLKCFFFFADEEQTWKTAKYSLSPVLSRKCPSFSSQIFLASFPSAYFRFILYFVLRVIYPILMKWPNHCRLLILMLWKRFISCRQFSTFRLFCNTSIFRKIFELQASIKMCITLSPIQKSCSSLACQFSLPEFFRNSWVFERDKNRMWEKCTIFQDHPIMDIVVYNKRSQNGAWLSIVKGHGPLMTSDDDVP